MNGQTRNDLRSEQAVISDEKAAIGINRAERLGEPDAPWSGIGLSGGGIRSASFCLGVLQALAETDLLRRFDYISSVSGGGYIATSLQWWWGTPRGDDDSASECPPSRYPFGLGLSDFPYGPARPDPGFIGPPAPTHRRGMENLAFLRAHSSYLTPGHGLTFWSILGVLLRTILISSLTWLPMLAACFVVLSAFGYGLGWLFDVVRVPSPFFGVLPVRWTETCNKDLICHLSYPALYALGLWAVYIITAIVLASALLFALVSRAPQDSRHHVRTILLFGAGAIACAGGIWWIFAASGASDLDPSVQLIAMALAVTCAVWLVIAG